MIVDSFQDKMTERKNKEKPNHDKDVAELIN